MGNHDPYSDPACGGDYRGVAGSGDFFSSLLRLLSALLSLALSVFGDHQRQMYTADQYTHSHGLFDVIVMAPRHLEVYFFVVTGIDIRGRTGDMSRINHKPMVTTWTQLRHRVAT